MTIAPEDFKPLVDSKLIRFGGHWADAHIKSAKGSTLFDASGRKILDFTSGQMSAVLGHSHDEITAVIREQIEKVMHLHLAMVTDEVLECASAITSMLPPGLDKCMLLSTGSETNEAAMKMAKVYTGKFEVVSLSAGYHGMTHGSASATFSTGRQGAGPQVPGSLLLPAPYAYRSPFRHPDGSYDWKTELDYGWEMVDRQSTGSLACVLVETVLSTGGMLPLPDGYMKELKAHCEKRGALLIIDEAQTGLGRTGYNFDFEHYGVVPDILTLSKTLGAGLPLGAVVTSDKIEQGCFEKKFYFATTHLGDPLVAAVGKKVCEIVQRDNLADESARKGKLLRDGFEALQKKYPVIGDVRGRGLMLGVELVLDREKKTPADELGTAIARRCMQTGLSCNIVQLPGLGGSFRIAPPLTITEDEIREGVNVFGNAVAHCLGQELPN